MSRKVSKEEYEKTISFRFKQWLDGTKDPFLNTVEMKPQEAFHEDRAVKEQREEEEKHLKEKVYDTPYYNEEQIPTSPLFDLVETINVHSEFTIHDTESIKVNTSPVICAIP